MWQLHALLVNSPRHAGLQDMAELLTTVSSFLCMFSHQVRGVVQGPFNPFRYSAGAEHAQ